MRGQHICAQGSGKVNTEGAIRLAQLVGSELGVFRTNGAPLLNNAPPAPQTTIAAQPFDWAQGLVLSHTYATGAELITKYQGIYDIGHVLGDGVNESELQTVNTALMTTGVTLGSELPTSDGQTLP